MKRKILIIILSIVLSLASIVGLTFVFAYYEYYTSYKALLNIDGTIKLDAFDVLYEELRSDDYGYGKTKENPFIINNYERLYNLIYLNNNGKLQESKEADGVEKYYFALNFDGEDLAQVLDLMGKTGIEPIGNNEYPFTDELSGILYAYPYDNNSNEFVYYSGCCDKVEVTYNATTSKYSVDGVETDLTFSNGVGTYLKVKPYTKNTDGDIIFQGTDTYSFIKESDTSLKTIHQMIANATVTVSDSEIDVGFFGNIGTRTATINNNNVTVNGYVHDLILYNTNIRCVEDTPLTLHDVLLELWESLTGSHSGFAYEDNHDERHIGIFAGHIDGEAHNISLAGASNINIDTQSVNYYSQFTSVGYISPNAKIGGTLFSDIVLDMNDDTGSISGCMFADYIYRCAEDEENISSTTDSDGATHYLLTDIDPETGKWNGTINNLYFKYGSFNFVMSSAADTVSSIWSDSGELKLLNKQGYTINGSVLYCKDEYRYSEGIDDGGSLLPGIASANETKYAGISTAVNNSNLLDQGKYVICAKVPKVNNPSSASDYYYYALKIVAEIDSSTGTISYVFDNSSKCDITDYILDTSGEETIYSSAMWEVEEDSETPKFVNCRFSGQYLTKSVDNDEYDVALTSDSNNASEFMVNVSNHTFGFSVTSGDTYYQYYLNYRNNGTSESPDHEFYFSTVNNASIEIDVYLISNGFNLQLVTSTSDIVRSGDYIIVGKNGTNCYLLGVEIDNDVVVNEFANDYYWVNFDPSETVTLSFYQSIKNYIWHTNTLSGVGSASFRDKMSGTYFLTNSNGTLSLNTTESYFTYNEGTSAEGGDLYNGTGYLSFSYEEGDCGFSLGSSNYNIYLYQLIPDDNDPPYITYDGATYVDATSTPIDAGNYLILAHLNNNYYAVANNSGTISYSAGTMVSNLFTPSEGSIAYANCEWTVSTSSSTPTFVNNNYYITIDDSDNPVYASLSTTSKNWMYDASSYRVYYEVQTGTQTIDGEVIPVYSKYYLVWDTTNSVFKVTLDTDINTYCYDIELYESTYMYTYTGLTELTATSNNDATNGLSTTQTTENTSVGYIILTNQLQETWTNDSYAVGITGTGTSVSNYSVKTYNISDVSTYSNGTLTSSKELSYYMWYHVSAQNVDDARHAVHEFYNKGYRDNNNSQIYLAAGSGLGSRELTITNVENFYTGNINSGAITGFNFGTRDGNTLYAASIGFRGGSYTYVLHTTTIPGGIELISGSGYNNSSTKVYVYKFTGTGYYAVNNLITSDGDTLEADIHYMITAYDENNGDPLYYALSGSEDNGTVSLFSENVTSQAKNIVVATVLYGSLNETTMVPANADWTQTEEKNQLRFYHTNASSSSLRYFLDSVSSDIGITSVTTGSTNGTIKWYYEKVNKRLKCKISDVWYYVTFNTSTKEFGLSSTASNAADIRLFRYTPSYSVTEVTSFDNDGFKTGSFIVTGKAPDGYNAIGISGSSTDPQVMNITAYLKSHLSESEYNNIKDYVFKQEYYNFYTENYETHVNNGYVDMYLDAINGYGSFIVTSSGGAQSSSSVLKKTTTGTVWKITPVTSNGVLTGYKFVNDTANGTISAGSRYLTYTNNMTASLKVNGTYSGDGDYLNGLVTSYSFSSSGNNLILIDENGDVQTSISNGDTYYIKFSSYGVDWLVGRDGANATASILYDNDTTLINNANYQWTCTTSNGYIGLVNGGYYPYSNSSNGFSLSTTFYVAEVDSNGILSFAALTAYYPTYTNSLTTSTTETSTTRNLKLYTAAQSKDYYVFTVANSSNLDNSDYYLIYRNNNTYYLFYFDGTSLASYSLTYNQRRQQIRIDSNSLTNSMIVKYSDKTIISSNYTDYSLLFSTSSITFTNAATAQSLEYDDTHGIYTYIKGTSYSPKGLTNIYCDVTSTDTLQGVYFYKYENNEFSSYTSALASGDSYAIVIKENDKYYLLRYRYENTDYLCYVELGSDATSLSNYTSTDYLVTGVSGTLGIRLKTSGDKYLYESSNKLTLNSSYSEWAYYYVSPNGDGSTLRTRASGTIASNTLYPTNGNGSSVGYGTSSTYLYTVSNTNGVYSLGGLKTTKDLDSGTNYAIVIDYNNQYYIVSRNNSGAVYATLVSSLLDCTLSTNQIWYASSTSALTTTLNDTTYYLVTGASNLVLSESSSSTWSYSVSGSSSASFGVASSSNSAFHIFKVTKNEELDRITDVETLLNSKMIVTASASLQTSSNYLIAASIQVNGSTCYYALGMESLTDTIAIDVTDIMTDALTTGSTITLFDANVWRQDGVDYTLLMHNIGFFDDHYHYLSGVAGNRSEGMQPIVSDLETLPQDLSDYNWRTYKSGNNNLFGFTDNNTIYYLYFDSSSLSFKLTENTATATNGLVTLYQLGANLSSLNFVTVNLELASDQVTILNYPLKEVEADDIVSYNDETVEGVTVVTGEYVILAKDNDSYYALTYNDNNELIFVDVMLYFSGNYSKDTSDNYCFSVNERYVWKQTGTNPDFTFENLALRTELTIDGTTTLTYSNHQLKGGDKYLNFARGSGYTTSTSTSSKEIFIYELGTHGIAVSDPESDLSYTYYHTALTTTLGGGVSYSNFAFETVEIGDLKDYSYDESNSELVYTNGWKILGSNSYLSSANASTYFKDGVSYDSDSDTFKDEFNQFTYTYEELSANDVVSHDITYYIPNGVDGFVIPYASSTEPVFINVIASTELDSAYNISYLRYLALWKVANLDLENYVAETILEESATQENFAKAMISRFNKPYAAIPLPNHYGSVASGASLVCVAEDGNLNEYNLVNVGTEETPLSYDHLIAHTFCITSPGIYYLGSTYGTIAISYISIDNLYSTELGEDSGTSISDDFSIDFVWGDLNTNAPSGENYSSTNYDSALGDIGYVGYVGTNVVSGSTITDPSWVHSNIFPFFTNGTQGLIELDPEDLPERSSTYNPTDNLALTISRSYDYDSNASLTMATSTLAITGTTLTYIYNNDGIKYLNDNTLLQRHTRFVTYNITLSDSASENEGD